MSPLRKCRVCGKEANTTEELTLFTYDKNSHLQRRTTCKECAYKHHVEKYPPKNPKRTKAHREALVCCTCGVKLTDENWKGYMRRKQWHQCFDCYKKVRTKWAKTHKPQRREYERKRRADPIRRSKENQRTREYARKNIIGTYINGKQVHLKVKKRPWRPQCELCGRLYSKPAYHHWDNEHPERGMYVCNKCHLFANLWEKGFQEKYLSLKESIINDSHMEL